MILRIMKQTLIALLLLLVPAIATAQTPSAPAPAASGARRVINSVAIGPGPLWLSRWRKNIPNCASMEMAPAMVAVIVMMRVS